jgi:hypothetical protein
MVHAYIARLQHSVVLAECRKLFCLGLELLGSILFDPISAKICVRSYPKLLISGFHDETAMPSPFEVSANTLHRFTVLFAWVTSKSGALMNCVVYIGSRSTFQMHQHRAYER